MRKRTLEPMLWLLFSGGGVLVALLAPILLLLLGLAVPLGWATLGHGHALAVLQHPLTRVVLFLLCATALFHWAHRFRYTLYDGLQVKHLNELINVFCYGGAIAGTVIAGYLLWHV